MAHIDRVLWTPKHPNETGWKDRHLAAMANPTQSERGLRDMLKGWLIYADAYKEQFGGDGIGADAVLGPEWAHIGLALRTLLNGDLGRMDGGTLDHIIAGALTDEGFDPDTLTHSSVD